MLCEMVFRLFVIESVFLTDTYLNRRIVPRVIWLQKTICRTVMTDNLIWNSQSSKIILSQSTDRWICLVDIGKCKSILKKKTFFKPGDGNVVCLCCVPTRLKTAHFLKKHGSCVVVLVVLPHAFSQINGCKTKKICFEGVTYSLLSLHS